MLTFAPESKLLSGMNAVSEPKFSSSQILFFLVGFCLIGSFLGNLLIMVILHFNQLDLSTILQNFNENSTLAEKKYLVNILAINHLSTFLIPGLILAPFVYGADWTTIVTLQKPKKASFFLLGALWLLISYPLVEWLYKINRMIPLPGWLNQIEDSTNEMVISLLGSGDWWLLLMNIFVMGLLPAIGEELVFRGLVQPNMIKWVKKPYLGILLTAAIFSAIHMQFQGFIPRMGLGFVLGLLAYWSKNLWAPILAHFCNNAMQVCLFYIVKKYNIDVDLNNNLEFPVYILIISLLLVLIIGWYFYRKQRDLEKVIKA